MKKNPLHPVLIIDDNKQTLESLELLLYTTGITNSILCSDSRKVTGILEKQNISLILLDLNMPHISGEELLESIKTSRPEIPVIVITAVDQTETVVKCMRLGAYDYFTKPIVEEILLAAVHRGIENTTLKEEIRNLTDGFLSKGLQKPEVFSSIITNNSQMLRLFSYMEVVAPSREPVLILGEHGSGKELFARAIHESSGLKGQFVTVNIAGLDDTMLADTLFGHTKGAYTGAQGSRKGLVETASNGTLFLDEIGDLSPASQVKLLRLLQEKEYYPLGSDIPKKANTRILAATNKNLDVMQEKYEFRKDLFYRLKVHNIKIPALKNRQDDIPLLVDFFVRQAVSSYQKGETAVSPNALELLTRYEFPGNIRELRGIIFDAVCLCDTTIEPSHFESHLKPEALKETPSPAVTYSEDDVCVSFPGKLPTLKQIGHILTQEAMRRTGGNKTQAAKILGVTHQGLSKRLRKQQE